MKNWLEMTPQDFGLAERKIPVIRPSDISSLFTHARKLRRQAAKKTA